MWHQLTWTGYSCFSCILIRQQFEIWQGESSDERWPDEFDSGLVLCDTLGVIEIQPHIFDQYDVVINTNPSKYVPPRCVVSIRATA
jgi:hypothetical protein